MLATQITYLEAGKMQKMMGLMRKCIDDYHMISPGDKIAVGVSGGKDSLTLLTVLAALRSYYPAPFELAAITIDMGRPDDGDMAGQAAFAREICEKLAGQAGTENTPVAVRGETPIRPYYTPRDRHGNPINILKVKPKTDPDRCGGCGLCAELCPMGSIDPADVSQVRGICIKCCACVKKCPSGAKYFDDPGYLFHQHELEDVYTRRAENEWFV